ncbi:hypothetical protein GCM10023115_53320 [Pontixanthobacter gangjinensis]|uniref:VWA domain-containing protein n=1 Tax=Christiangramia aestuarii TaxID=1028746 RepID=A0A7K1LQ38_9FLAO|nr:VWA domain-containing protein [Christiangramia aestuarii]MUP42914.1 VWA domain-containing protein [Christiangramia aestuarii]
MTTETILYITLALLVALGFAFFQYLYNRPVRNSRDYILFSLRALAVFLVLLILINPKITSTSYQVDKPELVLLADNSQSISFLEAENDLKEISNAILSNERIRQNFEVSQLNFGDKIGMGDSLNFSAVQTDIYSALSETRDLFSGKNSAVVLLTDGNQSLGRDFRYFKKNGSAEVFPIVLGDTTRYKDLSIERINLNRYAFLNNRFPLEIFLNYSGREEVKTKLNIRAGGNIVFSKELEFSEEKRSEVIRTDLPATSLGVKTYQVELEPVAEEKNTINNLQKFAIEVIDERTSVLILSSIAHPDLGAMKKAIESNEQRTADIKYIRDDNLQPSVYQLIILYQLNNSFNKTVAEILEKKYNYLVITGSKTDWNYLNNLDLGYSKSWSNQPQEIFPVYNPTFSSFQFEDIGFDDMPPVIDKFGPLDIQENRFNILLYQEQQGVETGEALMGVTQDAPKSGFLFGENIWRWRAKTYLDNKSFQEFDDFFGKLIQNLSSSGSKQRLMVEAENFYYANQNVLISAQYFDENYQFDPGAGIKISVENKETGDSFTSDLVLKNNFYQFDGGDLPAGEYAYNIRVANKKLSKSGSFEVIEYNTEQQFVSSNLSGLQSFAENNETDLFYAGDAENLINSLLANDKLKPVQKSRQKTLPLIDWYYLLFILIFILAVEWFYRKYLGLI